MMSVTKRTFASTAWFSPSGIQSFARNQTRARANARLMTTEARRFGAKRHSRLNNRCAIGGMMVRATMIDAINAKVLVKASGRNRRPASPVMLNTGRKLTTVVATEVVTAEATSVTAS
jgi:hypothetical protein